MRQVPFIPRALAPMLSVVTTGQFAHSMMMPMLVFIFFGEYSTLFSSDATHATRSMYYGIAMALTQIIGVVANVVMGIASDRLGRRWVLGFSLVGLVTLGWGVALGLYSHSLIMVMFAIGCGSFLFVIRPAGLAIVGDMSSREDKVKYMALLQCFISIGACLGPILGGQLGQVTLGSIHYVLPFLIAGAIVLFMLGVVWRMKETRRFNAATAPPFRQLWSEIRHLLRIKAIWIWFCILLLSQLSWGIYYEFVPAVMKVVFHFDTRWVGFFTGMIAFWLIVATTIGIRLLLRCFSRQGVLIVSVGLIVIGTWLSLVACIDAQAHWARWVIWLAVIPTAMGDVMLYSLIVSGLSDAVASQHQGKIMGLMYVVIAVVWTVTGLLGGGLMAWLPYGALIFAPFGVTVLAILLVLLRGCDVIGFGYR